MKIRQAARHAALGDKLSAQQNYREAVQHYERALIINPKLADTLHNLSVAFLAIGRPEDAIPCSERAVHLRPNIAELHCHLGDALRLNGQLEKAIPSYQEALRQRRGYVAALNNLGVTFEALGRLDEAAEQYRYAQICKPDEAEPFNNLGNVLSAKSLFAEAIQQYEAALKIRPDYAEAHNSLGAAFEQMGSLREAVSHYTQALSINPGLAEAFYGLGNTLIAFGKVKEGRLCLEKAISLKPLYAAAYNNLGISYSQWGEFDEARRCYESTLRIEPRYAEARSNLSVLQLLEGDFSTGWLNYEYRWETPLFHAHKPIFEQPIWRGELLNGSRILLHSEQGLGDSIQFLRYISKVQAAGGRVVLKIPATLRTLALSSLTGNIEVAVPDEPLPAFDWHCPLMSLPLAFGTTLESIPAQVPYLFVPAITQGTDQPLASKTEDLSVGLVWAGNPGHARDQFRSIPLALLKPLMNIEHVKFFSLQYGKAADDLTVANMPITNLAPFIKDMGDTAAYINSLDLVITVDTSVAHLAGALGKPVWILLSTNVDFRWLLEREDSPWYPTARLFRQSAPQEWEPVVERMALALGQIAQARESSRQALPSPAP
ncbi:tetratricopeptide (TPR) repeat protein [Granulicella aggregans]|uniref:Tetratricopeptide (TPR) repeat protein n=1 Tax=Granulicella aggregans TaxID=474949 RepID=A0A7W8E652_9BACT|nr:tetratricopeptide repeat protein [Granulicella aggregans]MBB5060843.1 tetratricopeptide (TPR) repeat protein [Granulicella aggregans]